MRLRSMLALCAATATAVSVLGVPAGAQGVVAQGRCPQGRQRDVREIPPNKTYKLDADLRRSKRAQKVAGATATPNSAVRRRHDAPGRNGPVSGSRSTTTRALYPKSYTLQAVGAKIEVWVADDTSFPADDCRNQVADSTTVTRAQAQELADQFDSNMFPKESQAFSVAPDRDGSGKARSRTSMPPVTATRS